MGTENFDSTMPIHKRVQVTARVIVELFYVRVSERLVEVFVASKLSLRSRLREAKLSFNIKAYGSIYILF